MQKQEAMLPWRRGSSHCCFCCSLPYMWSSSMFPVSTCNKKSICFDFKNLLMWSPNFMYIVQTCILLKQMFANDILKHNSKFTMKACGKYAAFSACLCNLFWITDTCPLHLDKTWLSWGLTQLGQRKTTYWPNPCLVSCKYTLPGVIATLLENGIAVPQTHPVLSHFLTSAPTRPSLSGIPPIILSQFLLLSRLHCGESPITQSEISPP